MFRNTMTTARTMSTIVSQAIAKDIRSSATLIVAAPTTKSTTGHNYELLMMKRNAKSSFINAHVFPGGVVDKHDENWKMDNVSDLTNKICAIRETFEESGLLLTHPPAHTVLKDAATREEWRERVHNDASQFKVLCESHKLVPAVDKLIPFANWITPAAERRRYNAQFYLTVLDPSIAVQETTAADGKELVQLDWFTPEQALSAWREEKIVLIPPQWYSLHVMGPVKDHKDLASKAGLGALRTMNGHVSTIMPQHGAVPENDKREKEGYHTFLAYPGDEAYLDIKTGNPSGNPGDRHRIYIQGRMQYFDLEKNVNVPEPKSKL
ncbi:hypothetical protein BDA99DRAFT_205797 [Phascolomyces articulosus]|uniref:Nudix hydrolase domain-containing protein n=1 Tax=Phascolomyces articulosus TaxID=60185 RepID=A0AAD5PBB0_9FUNG|nr:hypothetical protein BDA99DRAFT_205797 [Phascolomyces articulosus]